MGGAFDVETLGVKFSSSDDEQSSISLTHRSHCIVPRTTFNSYGKKLSPVQSELLSSNTSSRRNDTANIADDDDEASISVLNHMRKKSISSPSLTRHNCPQPSNS